MLNIPGYTLRGAITATSTNLLFHAVRHADSRPLILKTPIDVHSGTHASERYRREFAILQRLQGVPGVTRVHACERFQERPVLLLEEVEGIALSEFTGRSLEVRQVLDLAISLASTLAELHRRGVIHKDIKPSNIMVTPAGETCLLDFGIATVHLVEHVEAAPAPLVEGTLPYMSPEQTGRMNRTVDYRTDLYSLGVTLYELLTGSRPFHAGDALEWFHAHMAQVPQPPHERVPSLPPILSAVVLKLLAKVAEERYQSAEGLKADLERCRANLRQGILEDFPLGEHDCSPYFQLPQRLYGRSGQAATLMQAFERVSQGSRPELLLVRGYSGSGKSAVVHELHKPVVRQRGFFLQGKFEPFQQSIPYTAFVQALRGLTQQLLAGSDEELARWRAHLNRAWEGHGQLLVDMVPQLELVVGEQPPEQGLLPSEAPHRFNRVFRQLLGVLATPEHPLVLFLDDLQWADQASLRLIHYLLTHAETPPVLLIGSFRDNEVTPSHPLSLTLEELRGANARMTSLQLEPLSLGDVQQLIADTLPGAGEEIVQPLSALAREKTGGNPFFLLQFLRTLHQDGLLMRTSRGSWEWDAEGVRTRNYSDNVVDFMVGRLRQLSPGAQHLLRLAACLGNTFSLPMLSLLHGQEDVAGVEQGLEPALQEGMLMRSGPEKYRFLHDRIQQAAQALLDEQECKVVHLSIGRLLLERLSAEEVREKLFDVVSQFNAGAELISDPEERRRVAGLNAEAGEKAQASTAFRSAAVFLATAFQFLPGDPWETDPAWAFKFRLEQARCEFMSGQAAEARRLLEDLRPRARSWTDTAAIYLLKNDLHVAAGDIPAALSCLLEALALMGMEIPPHPSWDEVVRANAEVWTLLGERPIDSIVERPLMTDPDKEAMMNVLAALFVPALVTDVHLLIFYLCRLVSLSLRHGNSAASVLGYSLYGMVLGQAFKRYREGHAFGLLACELVERHEMHALRAKALYGMEMVAYWTRPLSLSLDLIREAFPLALKASDFQVAGYCCNHIVTNRLALGHDLEDVYQESIARLDFARKADFVDVRDVIHYTQRYVQQLRGLTPSFHSLSGDDFDEVTFESSLTPERMCVTRFWYWTLKMQSRFMCGAYAEARELGDRAAPLVWSSMGHIQVLDLHLFRALSLGACFQEMTPEEQHEALSAMRGHQQQLAEWASFCPENFRAPERLVFAELARVTNRESEALHAYEEALRVAHESGRIQYEALACELGARYLYARGLTTLADSYALKARESYLRWGAKGKAAHLATLWPHLTSRVAQEPALDTESTRIDALTVVKAQQAISGEIVLERLAALLLRVAMENAGAQRGVLLLPHGDQLSVVALLDTPSENAAPQPREDGLPWSLLAYVKRTREHVLIGDAAQPHLFSGDPWFERGQARSVLCLPLLRQDALRGVLYLENNLATHAFTRSRLMLLEHLASQAAVSIENAQLYAEVQRGEAALRRANDDLEKRVEERTRELKQAQARLMDTARAAGMAEVATSVLHNVGNVLTSAVINLQSLLHLVDASRMGRLRQVAVLLEEHRADLPGFLTRDPRGIRLTDYISGLSHELLREHGSLNEGLRAMSKHIEHIRAIVHVQQSYAGTTLLIEECELHLLIEDALSLQLPSLHRHGITVTQELSVLPKVRVDKHRVLQILVNLIINAKSALNGLPEGQRRLHLRLGAEGAQACIQVVDNGMGFTANVRERLFRQGFTTREGGHGLGLHSSALSAKSLGGQLSLESEGPGKGATATLRLPLLSTLPLLS